MFGNASKLFCNKLDKNETLFFEKIKYSNSISSSHGTSLASNLCSCTELTSNDSVGSAKTCERHAKLPNEPFSLEEKPSVNHLYFKKIFLFDF